MVAAGLFGLVVAWRTVRGARGRTLAVAAAAVLGGLALPALVSALLTWTTQRDGFERAQDEPGLSYAAPGPLLDVIVVPGSLIPRGIALVVTSRQMQRAG